MVVPEVTIPKLALQTNIRRSNRITKQLEQVSSFIRDLTYHHSDLTYYHLATAKRKEQREEREEKQEK